MRTNSRALLSLGTLLVVALACDSGPKQEPGLTQKQILEPPPAPHLGTPGPGPDIEPTPSNSPITQVSFERNGGSPILILSSPTAPAPMRYDFPNNPTGGEMAFRLTQTCEWDPGTSALSLVLSVVSVDGSAGTAVQALQSLRREQEESGCFWVVTYLNVAGQPIRVRFPDTTPINTSSWHAASLLAESISVAGGAGAVVGVEPTPEPRIRFTFSLPVGSVVTPGPCGFLPPGSPPPN